MALVSAHSTECEQSWPPPTSFKDQEHYVFASCLFRREFFFCRTEENKSEKIRRNIQIMYFNVFFPGHVYIRRNFVCRTRWDTWKVSSKEMMLCPLFCPSLAHTIFITKVNDFSCRGDDTHTWFAIDAVLPCRILSERGFGKIFSFDPFTICFLNPGWHNKWTHFSFQHFHNLSNNTSCFLYVSRNFFCESAKLHSDFFTFRHSSHNLIFVE